MHIMQVSSYVTNIAVMLSLKSTDQLEKNILYIWLCFIIVAPNAVGSFRMVGSVCVLICLSVTHFFGHGMTQEVGTWKYDSI